MKNRIFQITLLKWLEHNPNAKKSYKKTLIEHSIINDAKINAMPLSNKWLFFNLIMICGDHAKDTVTLTERQINGILTTREGATNALDRLQSFQLLKYEEIVLNKVKEVKEMKEIKEKKIITARSKIENPEKLENAKIWEVYFNAYRLRYGVEPVRNAQVNTQVSSLRKKLGFEDACKVVEFYLNHNDSWYVKNTHSFGLCLQGAETLRTQMLRGQAITQTEIRRFEKAQQQTTMIDEAKKGGF